MPLSILSPFCVYRREDSNLHGFPLDTEYNLDNTLFEEVKILEYLYNFFNIINFLKNCALNSNL